MKFAMDGSDESAGCTCQIGLTTTELNFLVEELTKWRDETFLSRESQDWRRGFNEAMRLALANIKQLTEIDELEQGECD